MALVGGHVSRGNQLEYRIVLSDKFSIVSSFLFRYQLSIDWYLMYINRYSLISIQKYNKMYLFLYFWMRNWFFYKINKKNIKKTIYLFIKFIVYIRLTESLFAYQICSGRAWELFEIVTILISLFSSDVRYVNNFDMR